MWVPHWSLSSADAERKNGHTIRLPLNMRGYLSSFQHQSPPSRRQKAGGPSFLSSSVSRPETVGAPLLRFVQGQERYCRWQMSGTVFHALADLEEIDPASGRNFGNPSRGVYPFIRSVDLADLYPGPSYVFTPVAAELLGRAAERIAIDPERSGRGHLRSGRAGERNVLQSS